MRRKKNSFFTFIWSFMPGAAEMYMGFMKCGLSLMGLFLATLVIPMFCYWNGAFLLIAMLIWFYSFFHARNLAACTEETLQSMEDEFIWDSFTDGSKTCIGSPTLRKWGAATLIVIGASMLWKNFKNVMANMIPEDSWNMLWPIFDKIPQIAISVLIIAIGIGLIVGKKREIRDEE